MENGLENLMGNNEDLTHQRTTGSFVRRFDRLADSNLGITALTVLGTPLAFYIGAEVLQPVTELVLNSAAVILGASSSELDSTSEAGEILPYALSGIAAMAIYGKTMGNFLQRVADRNQRNVPEEHRDYEYNREFFSKVFYADKIKSGLKRAAGYFSRNKKI